MDKSYIYIFLKTANYAYVRVPLALLALPSFNRPVTDKLDKKKPLNSTDFSHVARELGRDIKKITLHPHPEAFQQNVSDTCPECS